ncbi:uncharacterized protein LOC111342370 [Stylophora pistillata]|uniref:uncharacterized protein LOC111342370 n=1 Tax=Stylophora pistillata TaxID=50429 RepID=UPI000C051612|nr:uncharacterized protein LOC111342370 [Stylophora pistillata]
MMNLFRSEVYRWVLATLLLCSAIEKSESFEISSRPPSNPVIVILGDEAKLEWQFSDAPSSYFVQFWRQKPGEKLKQIATSKNGNAFNPSDTTEFKASLPAKLTLKNVQRNEEYTYSIILLDSNAVEVERDTVTIDVVGNDKLIHNTVERHGFD